jgi:hypothetical protein
MEDLEQGIVKVMKESSFALQTSITFPQSLKGKNRTA